MAGGKKTKGGKKKSGRGAPTTGPEGPLASRGDDSLGDGDDADADFAQTESGLSLATQMPAEHYKKAACLEVLKGVDERFCGWNGETECLICFELLNKRAVLPCMAGGMAKGGCTGAVHLSCLQKRVQSGGPNFWRCPACVESFLPKLHPGARVRVSLEAPRAPEGGGKGAPPPSGKGGGGGGDEEDGEVVGDAESAIKQQLHGRRGLVVTPVRGQGGMGIWRVRLDLQLSIDAGLEVALVDIAGPSLLVLAPELDHDHPPDLRPDVDMVPPCDSSHDPAAPAPAAGTGAAAGQRVCCNCKIALPKAAFSRAQWSKGRDESACRGCVETRLQPPAALAAPGDLSAWPALPGKDDALSAPAAAPCQKAEKNEGLVPAFGPDLMAAEAAAAAAEAEADADPAAGGRGPAAEAAVRGNYEEYLAAIEDCKLRAAGPAASPPALPAPGPFPARGAGAPAVAAASVGGGRGMGRRDEVVRMADVSKVLLTREVPAAAGWVARAALIFAGGMDEASAAETSGVVLARNVLILSALEIIEEDLPPRPRDVREHAGRMGEWAADGRRAAEHQLNEIVFLRDEKHVPEDKLVRLFDIIRAARQDEESARGLQDWADAAETSGGGVHPRPGRQGGAERGGMNRDEEIAIAVDRGRIEERESATLQDLLRSGGWRQVRGGRGGHLKYDRRVLLAVEGEGGEVSFRVECQMVVLAATPSDCNARRKELARVLRMDQGVHTVLDTDTPDACGGPVEVQLHALHQMRKRVRSELEELEVEIIQVQSQG